MTAAKSKKKKQKLKRLDGRKPTMTLPIFMGVFGLLLIASAAHQYLTRPEPGGIPPLVEINLPVSEETNALSLEEIQEQGLIIDVHEHIESLKVAPVYIEAMDDLGIAKVCLMGSSKFTLTMNERYGFTGYDENNNALIDIVNAYPGRFEAWPTLSPTDPNNLTKLKDLVARGATGVKLYNGHGYLTRTEEPEFLFHPVAMDAPNMLPVYAYCEENFIPICIHVNPYDDGTHRGKPGFAEEFIAVLTQFPNLKVDAPHFILSSVHSARFEEFMDTFPNVYSNISFGDSFMKERLIYISKNPRKFTNLFHKYADRLMFASDLVLDEVAVRAGRKTPAWVKQQMQAYIDMLSKKKYASPHILDETGKPMELNGLDLPGHIIEAVLYKNYLRFSEMKPTDTKITREIDWSKMGRNREPIEREPGQAFPPRKKPN